MSAASAEPASPTSVSGAGSHLHIIRATDSELAVLGHHPLNPAAPFLSLLLSALLYGLIIHQMLRYWFSYALFDRLFLRAWVAAVWFTATLGAVMGAVNAFEVLTELPTWLASFNAWSAPFEQLVHAVVVVLVQLFYILQIIKIRRKMYPSSPSTSLITALLALLSSAGLGCWIWLSVVMSRIPTTPAERFVYDEAIQTSLLAKLCIDTVCDFIITVALVWVLRENISGYHPDVFYRPHVGRRMERLMYFLFARGLIVLVSQIAVLIATLTVGYSNAISAVSFCIPNIYVLSMLCVLTDREQPSPDVPVHLSRSRRDSRISISVTFAPEYSTYDE